ncbi:MAG TPA: glycosyltransferase family A protein, partial [Acidobacteriota bacterium]|nr:glycosyltransferase family A protein [Acidobacteriota bacterium]
MMPDALRISVVITAYNRAATVARAIDSALSQEFPPAEIIVIDDGSTDTTGDVIKRYAARCRYLRQENAGVSSARNEGVRASGGDWVAFLDSDDYWERGHLLRLAEAARATAGEAAFYFCDAVLPPGEGRRTLWERSGFTIDGSYSLRRDASPWVMRPVQPMLLQASLIRRSGYWDVGGLPPDLRTREDTLLFFKLGLRFPACAVAGRGTIMTSDDARRLTREIASADSAYWQATLRIYRALIAFASRTRPEHVRYFRARL